jgi:broad specificity phosphatase PhoE
VVTTILLVRHATIDAGHDVLWGRSPVSLNATGIMEAESLASALAGIPVDAVLSSPQLRARQTAAAIARRAGVATREDSDLDEFDFGCWAGKRFAELNGDPRWAYFNEHRRQAAAPGGESTEDVRRRALRAMARCVAGDKAIVVAVTHAEIVRLLLMTWLGLNADGWSQVPVQPASLSVIDVEPTRFLVRKANLSSRSLHADPSWRDLLASSG